MVWCFRRLQGSSRPYVFSLACSAQRDRAEAQGGPIFQTKCLSSPKSITAAETGESLFLWMFKLESVSMYVLNGPEQAFCPLG